MLLSERTERRFLNATVPATPTRLGISSAGVRGRVFWDTVERSLARFVRMCQMGDVLRCRYRHDGVMIPTEMNLANSDVSHSVEPELPTGTVTFLLTDIEGSTKLWEAGADETAISVARHYELLEAAVALHGGVRPVEQGACVASAGRAHELDTAVARL